jgi:hypothetical protein
MPDWLSFYIDGRSFLLGVIAGALLSFILSQFKGILPQIQTIAKRWLHNLREKNFAGIEAAFRLAALKTAQKSHLSAQLFSLDEILITPKLMAPPAMVDPIQPSPPDSILSASFPYLPDWPELGSQYNIESISLGQALQLGANLVIVGQPGCGKTTALAHLATQLARKDPALDSIQSMVPIFLHIQDLLPHSQAAQPQNASHLADPLNILIKAISHKLPILVQNQVPSFLKLSLAQGESLLLLDGLDELSDSTLKEAVDILRNLLKGNPKLRVVTTSSSAFLDGLAELNFYPVALAAWNYQERTQFVQNWGKMWTEQVLPEIKRKSQIEPLDPVFVNSWVNRNSIHLTPLEWTLNLWAIYSGESEGIASSLTALDNFVTRYIPDTALLESVQKLAMILIKNRKASFVQEDLDTYFAKQANSQVQLFDPGEAPLEAATPEKTKSSKNKKDKTPAASPWISSLMQTGLVSEHPGRVYRFSHPAVTAYLAASAGSELEMLDWLSCAESWDTPQLALGYYCGLHPAKLTIPNDWIQGTAPLFRKPLAVGRWLKFIPTNLPIRSKLLKRMADGLLDEELLDATRLRFSSALLCSNDPSLTAMFRQLLGYPKARVRSMASIALGALQDVKSINQLTGLLSDPEEMVRKDACFALGILHDPAISDILTECLSADDEILRQVSAESLAGDPQIGQEILKQAIQSENLLVRRSVVFGLARIRAPWSKEILEQVAVQDGQWVVRNAAGEALETIQKPMARIPYPLINPSETPWILTYASKLGVGIPPGDPAQEIFVHALQSGTPEEKIAALSYLRAYTDEKVASLITETALTTAHPAVSDAAQFALWYRSSFRAETAK